MRTKKLMLALLFAGAFGWQTLAPNVASAAPPTAAAKLKSNNAAPGRIVALQSVSGLQKPMAETALRLSKARVVLADYPLIKHDFGKALEKKLGKKLADISNGEIDQWLLDSTAYISKPQAAQTGANTEIPVDARSTTALRPADYGRALVFQPAPGVLIDVKGSGGEHPHEGGHSNGLATLGESIREFAYEKMIHKVLEHSKSGVDTVGHYAVIDAGFDVKWGSGNQDPAGLVLRQAHTRAKGDKSALNMKDATKIESILRTYGITSAGAYQYNPFDLVNLQGTKRGAVLDFGGFLVMPNFEKPAYHFDYSPTRSANIKPMLGPGGNFPQPDEKLRVPFNTWGYSVSGKADPIADNPSIWSHELARSLRDGRATRENAEQHMHNLMDEVDNRLR